MGSKVNRIGEEGVNNFGSKMVIKEYRKYSDIDVYFPEYDWVFKGTQYINFKNGQISCPYERRCYGVGYIGEGKYKGKENGKLTRVYSTWHSMLQRCYDSKYHEKHPSYINCEVLEEWHNFQNFGEWFDNNYYEIEGERMCLDKDILIKGNKIYSPDNCIFVPHNINILFTKRDNNRGKYPIGVSYNKQDKKFQAYFSIYDFEENKTKQKHLGYYNTPQEAFETYKQFKEKHIKKVADYYKGLIPKKLYDSMYNYKVDIND